MSMVTEAQVKATIRSLEEKLVRQQAAVDATKGFLELLNQQVDKPIRKP